jgi:hypothetical protein
MDNSCTISHASHFACTSVVRILLVIYKTIFFFFIVFCKKAYVNVFFLKKKKREKKICTLGILFVFGVN